MVLKLYGYSRSSYTRLVALICKEKNIPFEFILVDLAKGEQKVADYLKRQPFGVVPYIDDDGFILYESRAIARYLIKKYPNQGTAGLIPTDPKEEALFEQASSIEAFNFDFHVSPWLFEKSVKKIIGKEVNEARASKYLANLEAKLDVYDAILGRQKYLAGDNLTLADLQHLPHGTLLFHLGCGDVLLKRPNVARWWNDISSRPAWNAVKNKL